MKRKLLALTLAMTTLMSTSMMVSADTLDDPDLLSGGQEVTGEAEVNLPILNVTVPTTANIVINPYKLEYTDDAGNKSTNQVVSAEQEIVNKSNVAVAINVADLRVSSKAEDITIATASTAKETAKAAFLYLEVIDANKDDAKFEDAYNKSSANQIVIPYVADDDTKTKKGAKDAIVTLAAGDATEQKAKFKIGGEVVANPTTTDKETKVVTSTPWLEDDEINIAFKFTFTPQIVEAATSTN